MAETGTIHDAAAVFSALRGDQVIELLSRLETDDAQRLLATAARMTSTTDDLQRARAMLASELRQPKHQPKDQQEKTNSSPRQSSTKKHKRSKQRNAKKSSSRSLDFLIDMPARDIRRLLSQVSTACWAPALISESKEVQDAVFDNVAPAIERILRQEMNAFDGNPQVARLSRKKIIDAANGLQPTASDSTLRKAG